MEDEDVLEENSIEDLLDESEDGGDDEEEQNEIVLGEIASEEEEGKEDEETLLSSELEFGEDPDYDDSVDDFDKEEDYSI